MCLFCVHYVLVCDFAIIGIVLQFGIIVVAGHEFFAVRIFENIMLLTIITWFAFDDSIRRDDCSICADADLRQATYNPRIFAWIIAAWISVFIHIISSIYANKLINHDAAVTMETLTTFTEDKKNKEEMLRKEYENL